MLALAVLAGGMGCGMKKDYQIKKMLSFLKYKYGEEFSYVESYAGQYGSSYSMIMVRSRNQPDRQALVRLSFVNGKKVYEDNYLAFCLKDALEAEIGKLAQAAFGECKCFYKLPQFVFPAGFPAQMKPKAFLQSPYSMAQFYIYPKNRKKSRKDREADLEEFRARNAEKGYKIRGTVSYPAGEEGYEGLTEESFLNSDYTGYRAEAEIVFSMDAEGNFRYARWLSEEKEGGGS